MPGQERGEPRYTWTDHDFPVTDLHCGPRLQIIHSLPGPGGYSLASSNSFYRKIIISNSEGIEEIIRGAGAVNGAGDLQRL